MKVSKVKQWCVSVFFIVFIVMASCTTTNVYNDALSAAEVVHLKIDPAFTVTSYNDVSVDWKTAFLGFGYTGATIPAGKTVLVMDLQSGRIGNTVYKGKDLIFQYNFEAGIEYRLRFWVKSGVYVMNTATDEEVFVEFLNLK